MTAGRGAPHHPPARTTRVETDVRRRGRVGLRCPHRAGGGERVGEPPIGQGWSGPLLAAKCSIPPQRPGGVVRGRLHDLLLNNGATRLTTVAAPAGWGKTTLLSAWAHDPLRAPSGRLGVAGRVRRRAGALLDLPDDRAAGARTGRRVVVGPGSTRSRPDRRRGAAAAQRAGVGRGRRRAGARRLPPAGRPAGARGRGVPAGLPAGLDAPGRLRPRRPAAPAAPVAGPRRADRDQGGGPALLGARSGSARGFGRGRRAERLGGGRAVRANRGVGGRAAARRAHPARCGRTGGGRRRDQGRRPAHPGLLHRRGLRSPAGHPSRPAGPGVGAGAAVRAAVRRAARSAPGPARSWTSSAGRTCSSSPSTGVSTGTGVIGCSGTPCATSCIRKRPGTASAGPPTGSSSTGTSKTPSSTASWPATTRARPSCSGPRRRGSSKAPRRASPGWATGSPPPPPARTRPSASRWPGPPRSAAGSTG